MERDEQNYYRNRSRRRKKVNARIRRLQMILMANLIVLLLVMGLLAFFLFTRLDREKTIEAGTKITPELFRHYDWDRAALEFKEELPNLTTEGTYKLKIEASVFTYSVKVQVKDTTSPVAKSARVVGTYGEPVEAKHFVTDIQDASDCVVTYAAEPDYTVYGTQQVSVLVTDQAGNKTTVSAELYIPNVKSGLSVEIGSSVPAAEEFLVNAGSDIAYITDVSSITMDSLGTVTVALIVDGERVQSNLVIVDTTAPEAKTKDVTGWLNKAKEADDFIDSVKDKTEVTAVFAEVPDWSIEGTQTVTLILTDEGGNEALLKAGLTLKKDTKKPEISVSNIDVVVGGAVSYKKAVNYSDNVDTKDEMTLTIERDDVDLNKVGVYTVTYTVTDCSGNSATATGKVNVMAEEPAWNDEEKIHAKADEILDSILKDGMTQREQAKAIYKWIKGHIGYINHSEKGDFMRGAYEGLFKRQGDCFVYAATAKELLTRAGIKNMDIVKSTVNPSHYWNLVDLGEGWYHFDSTPRKDKSEFFLLTDAELEKYSSSHKNTHIYDKSKYPEIQ